MSSFKIVTIIKLIVSSLTVCLLFYRLISRKQKDRRFFAQCKNFERIVLILLAAIAALSFFNFGFFHGRNYIHYWEIYHYYLGSKYSKELGYFDLYNATTVADAEDENFLNDMTELMDLRTYRLIPKEKVLNNTSQYKSKFSPRRWQEFKSDLRFFKKHFSKKRLIRILRDHGYNPSPTWNTTANVLSNIVRVDKIFLLTLLDVLLLVIMFAVIYFSFGLEVMLFTLTFFGINFLSPFSYIGGSYLRYDWLVCLVISLCMLHKNRYIPAGIFLSYASWVRMFPVLFLFGLGVKMIFQAFENKKIQRKYLYLFMAFILTSVILFAYGCIPDKGINSWKNFAEKIKLHDQFIYTNHVGFRMVFLYEDVWSDSKKFFSVYGRTKEDPFILWRQIKRNELNRQKIEFLIPPIFILFLLAYIVKNKDDTEAFVWGALLIFMFFLPACYYYSYLIVFILMFLKRNVNITNTVHIALLFIIQIIGYLIYFKNNFDLYFYSQLSMWLFIYFIHLIIFELYTKIRYQKPCALPR